MRRSCVTPPKSFLVTGSKPRIISSGHAPGFVVTGRGGIFKAVMADGPLGHGPPVHQLVPRPGFVIFLSLVWTVWLVGAHHFRREQGWLDNETSLGYLNNNTQNTRPIRFFNSVTSKRFNIYSASSLTTRPKRELFLQMGF